MESHKIKEDRRAKFLAKMQNKNKSKKDKKETDIKPPSEQKPQPIPQVNPIPQQPLPNLNNILNNNNSNNNSNSSNNNTNPDLSKFINNLNSFSKMINTTLKGNSQDNTAADKTQFQPNYQNTPKINYNEILEKTNQFDYMINFQSILKKILIIILTILHCLNYQPLNNSFIFKYTFIVLEMSSLLFNKYYNDQKNNLIKNIQNNNMVGQPPAQTDLFSFGIFNYVFFIFNLIRDIIADISIIIIINIMFFLIKNED